MTVGPEEDPFFTVSGYDGDVLTEGSVTVVGPTNLQKLTVMGKVNYHVTARLIEPATIAGAMLLKDMGTFENGADVALDVGGAVSVDYDFDAMGIEGDAVRTEAAPIGTEACLTVEHDVQFGEYSTANLPHACTGNGRTKARNAQAPTCMTASRSKPRRNLRTSCRLSAA
jgi:hypothetical protein